MQDWIIRPQLKGVPGVAGVDAIGGYVKQYHVQPDPAKLIALGLSFGDIARAIEANNLSRGATTIEQNGEGYVVRATGRVETAADIAEIAVATRASVPIRVKDIAEVKVGAQTRTGSGSEQGEEVVVGTALMLIGANSRTVAAAVDAKIDEIRRTLPPDVALKTVLNRTQLVDATIATVATNLAEGALLVIAVLFLLLGNFRAAVITAVVIPIAMLMTAIGMWQGRISANLMSLGALDFGLLVDGAVIITENSLRRLAARQHDAGRLLTLPERLETVRAAADEMIQPTVYGQAIIILVYVPLLTFSGVEGKMFEPMALTVIIALAAAFVLSITLVPALIAIAVTGRVREKRECVRPRLEAPLCAAAEACGGIALSCHRRRRPAVRRCARSLQPPRPGVHPDARRKEHRHARAAHPQHRADPIAGDAVCGGEDRQRLSAGGLRLLEDRHGRDRLRSDAAQRVRHFHHPKAARGVAGPASAQGRAGGGDRARREGAARQRL